MKNPTVLLVDDEPWFAEALRLSLEAEGFEFIIQTDMTSALQFLRSNNVSVVVTDIMMPPGRDYEHIDSAETGFHFVKLLKQEWPRLPVVCLSVVGDHRKIADLRREGVSYLRKGEVPLETAVARIKAVASIY